MIQQNQIPRPPTVLCVDDNTGTLKALHRVLHRYGCHVLLANNGPVALELLEHEQIDVIICDAAMPGMNGIEVLRQATQIAPGANRILLTAHCSNQDVVIPAINEAAIFRLLAKPWDDDELCRTVAEALGLDPVQWRTRQQPHQTIDRTRDIEL